MSTSVPLVSVVIPTHNRLPELELCLAALARQTFPRRCMEIVVVADGCTDGTVDALNARGIEGLRAFEQPKRGAASARNHGAREARGDVVLFLDDDVIASEGVVAAHAERHGSGDGVDRVVVGPYVPNAPDPDDFLQCAVHAFWRRLFKRMAAPNHEPHYTDIVSGNLSLRRETFWRVGGFSEEFAIYIEDYELGVRLLKAGVQFEYVDEAAARHLDTTDLKRSVARAYAEGRGTVTLVRLHPELFASSRLASRTGIWRSLALRVPQVAAGLAAIAFACVPVAQALRARRSWHILHRVTLNVAFWRGVQEAAGTDLRKYMAPSGRQV